MLNSSDKLKTVLLNGCKALGDKLWGYNPRYQQGCTWAEPLGEVQPTRLCMGHGTSGGPTYKMMPCEARHRSACLQDCVKLFGDVGNLFGYARSRNICSFLSCKTDQDRNNRSVTLPLELYKAGRDSSRFHLIIRNTIHKDIGRRVLRQADGLNLSNRCLLCSVSPSGSFTHTSTDSSTTIGIPLGRLPARFHRQWHAREGVCMLNSW